MMPARVGVGRPEHLLRDHPQVDADTVHVDVDLSPTGVSFFIDTGAGYALNWNGRVSKQSREFAIGIHPSLAANAWVLHRQQMGGSVSHERNAGPMDRRVPVRLLRAASINDVSTIWPCPSLPVRIRGEDADRDENGRIDGLAALWLAAI